MEETAVKKAISRVIDERSYYGFTGNPRVKEFEGALAKIFGQERILALNSGTDALVFALLSLNIGKGDEVIVPSFSFISTASCVGWVGAKPVFVDIQEGDFALDPSKIEEKITPKTKAILVAHLFGQPATGMEEILAMAKRYNLAVVEDAAQSFGAKVCLGGKWKIVGTIGDIGCLSFSSTKPFAAPGNGGAIIFNRNDGMYEKTDLLRYYGAKKHYFDYPRIGINAKLHEVQAAALLAKIPFLDYWFQRRQSVAQCYDAALSNAGDLMLPRAHSGTERKYYRYVVRTKHRDLLFNHLLNTVGKTQHLRPMMNYPVPLPHFAAFRELGHKIGDFPVSERLAAEVISLPITNYVQKQDAVLVTKAVHAFFDKPPLGNLAEA